jgi:hypothetical protein
VWTDFLHQRIKIKVFLAMDSYCSLIGAGCSRSGKNPVIRPDILTVYIIEQIWSVFTISPRAIWTIGLKAVCYVSMFQLGSV